MRNLVFRLLAAASLGCLALPLTARAADLDYDVLRGSDEDYVEPGIDWSGFYIGGHGGYGTSAFGFQNAFQPLVARLVANTTIESEMSVSTLLTTKNVRDDGPSYGVFLGYNAQFDDLVLGIEADYTRFDLNAASRDTIGRSKLTSDGFYNSVNLTGVSGTKIQDYGTIRGRVGYAIGSFMPFVTGGAVIGRARITDSVTVAASGYSTATPPLPSYTYFRADGVSKVSTVGGFALGAGLEYALTSNILLRGEYQYVFFQGFDNHKANINTVRGGVALKF